MMRQVGAPLWVLVLVACTGLAFGQEGTSEESPPTENPPQESALQEGEAQEPPPLDPPLDPPSEAGANDEPSEEPAEEPPEEPPKNAPPQEFLNGGMEEGDPGQAPVKWNFVSSSGATAELVTADPFEGAQAIWIDASKDSDADRPFTNLMQTLDATPWQGKRVRYRAAVKVGDLSPGATVNLWLRVDREGKKMGAFDNMGDRPITDEAWTEHEIVVDVADDAVHMVLGMFVVGVGTAWMDGATLEIVGEEVDTTGGSPAASGGYQMPEAVREARAVADKAPRQPFFSLWLILPAIAILLSLIAFWPTRSIVDPENTEDKQPGKIRWFAIRFAILYWLIYALPGPFQSILDTVPVAVSKLAPEWWAQTELEQMPEGASKFILESGSKLREQKTELDEKLVDLTANHVFDITGDLVPPNGSGDTTHSYLLAFAGFALAFVLALIWSLIRGNYFRHGVILDLLRSYLRYVLALAMLGYGLAKVTMEYNQFPMIGDWQMAKTWGDSSPMNVVWSFMGSSRPYTIFAGLSEVLAGVLLIWRRTSTLGGLAAVGVMTNVVMINYCYDVPVKLYSTHLLLMGILIALPDIGRVFRLLVLNRAVGVSGWVDAWSGAYLKWLRWPLKGTLIALCFAMPLYEQGKKSYGDIRDAVASQDDPADESRPLLVRRGYRWINEVPFNR